MGTEKLIKITSAKPADFSYPICRSHSLQKLFCTHFTLQLCSSVYILMIINEPMQNFRNMLTNYKSLSKLLKISMQYKCMMNLG